MAKSTAAPKPAIQQEELPANLGLTRFYLGLACFLSGAAIMVIEICAYRLLAPLFGNSVYTWTALIGVVLIAFSAGGFIGGRLADRHAGLGVLGWLLGGSSMLTFLIPVLHAWTGNMFADGGPIVGAIMISLVLFAVPGALLGAVSPAAVRFYSLTQRDTHVGIAAGTVSMLGSLGSFVGTFLSGFVLLGNFGVRSIFIGCAVLLLLLAAAAFVLNRTAPQSLLRGAAGVALAALLAAFVKHTPQSSGAVLYEKETYYHRIQVSEDGSGTHRQRRLRLDSTDEGGINPDTGELIYSYQNFWRLVQLKPGAEWQSALFIGAGAFGMPEEMSREYPTALIDVAEIDPEVIVAGRKFFNLDESPKVTAHATDARHFLRTHPERRWDLVFGDAYNGKHAIPSHLVTKEFFQLVSDHLTEDGVFIMNAITAIHGHRAQLLAGIVATLRTVFPHVEVFDVPAIDPNVSPGVRTRPQNVVLLASHQDWRPFIKAGASGAGIQQRIAKTHMPTASLPANGRVFTDDFNPVDAIIARGLLN